MLIISTDPFAFLTELQVFWDDFIYSVGMTSDILMYLDRTYVKANQCQNIREMALQTFRDSVIYSEQHHIKARLLNSFLKMIKNERNGLVFNSDVLSRTTQMLQALHISTYELICR